MRAREKKVPMYSKTKITFGKVGIHVEKKLANLRCTPGITWVRAFEVCKRKNGITETKEERN